MKSKQTNTSSRRHRVIQQSQVGSKTTSNLSIEEQIGDRVEVFRQRQDPLQHQHFIIQKRIEDLKQDLPHIHGYKLYTWAREFIDSRNKITLLCAANQISKSSTQIRKCIEWAGNKKLWPELWPTTPKIFWYFYPSEDVAVIEFEKKWVPEFMPRGAMKDHETYGWDVEYSGGALQAIHFKSGVSVYFKTYGQKAVNLQTATLHAIFCFTKGHLIITSQGLKRVEDVRVGDLLLGDGGWNTVTQAVVQSAPVIKKELANGDVLEATVDHPFWTYNRGWVGFSDLTPDDALSSFPGWKLIKKVHYLKASCLLGIQSIVTRVKRTILKIEGREPSTSVCGNPVINDKSPMAMSSTTKISILWTILSKIWNYCHALNTLESTRKKSGNQDPRSPEFVRGVINTLRLCHPRRLRGTGVPKDVGTTNQLSENVVNARFCTLQQMVHPRKLISVLWCVLSLLVSALRSLILGLVLGAMKFFNVGRTSLKRTVQETVPTEIKVIHTLTVNGSKTYLSNGIHCHNCDEEIPETLVDELLARVRATQGYFHQVFTATLGLPLWYRAMECIGTEDEAFKNAWKKTVSLYECQFYEDGSPSPWTVERIAEAEAQCSSRKESLKRIHGRFVRDEGLRYEAFDPERNISTYEPIPLNWKYYAGVDIGSGGKNRSNAAIVFVATNPDFTKARVVKTWRGDNIETASSDILRKYRELCGRLPITQACYDYASREFGIISARSGAAFIPADKAKNSGEQTANTLFKSGALTIDAGVYDNQKLVTELMSVPGGASKNRNYKDDLTDALRYCLALPPWNFAKISPGSGYDKDDEDERGPERDWTNEEVQAWEIRQRRGEMDPDKSGYGAESSFQAELDEWNKMYGA